MLDRIILLICSSGCVGAFIADAMTPESGTIQMQYLLLAAISALGAVVAYLHRENRKSRAETSERHTKYVAELVSRLDVKEAAITAERIARLDMLMQRLKEDTETKRDVTHAVKNNTDAIEDLKRFIKDFCAPLRDTKRT